MSLLPKFFGNLKLYVHKHTGQIEASDGHDLFLNEEQIRELHGELGDIIVFIEDNSDKLPSELMLSANEIFYRSRKGKFDGKKVYIKVTRFDDWLRFKTISMDNESGSYYNITYARPVTSKSDITETVKHDQMNHVRICPEGWNN